MPACAAHGVYLDQSVLEAVAVQGDFRGDHGVLLRSGLGYSSRACAPDARLEDDHEPHFALGATLQIALGSPSSPPFGDDLGHASLGLEARADWRLGPGTRWRLGPDVEGYLDLNAGGQLFAGVGLHATYEPVSLELEALRTGPDVTTARPGDPGSTTLAFGLRFGPRSLRSELWGEVAMLVVGVVVLAFEAHGVTSD